MKEIICRTDGQPIFVDDEDFPMLSRFPWYRGGMGAHPMTFIYGHKDASQTVYMHQLIMGGMVGADHEDRNVMNMQKSNLRAATSQENGWNKAKPNFLNKNVTSKFKGVRKEIKKKGGVKWLAYFKHVEPGAHKSTGKMIWIGRFDTEIEAAKAYNETIVKYRGKFAWVNPILENEESININNLQDLPSKGSS